MNRIYACEDRLLDTMLGWLLLETFLIILRTACLRWWLALSFMFHEKQKCICNLGSHFRKGVSSLQVVP